MRFRNNKGFTLIELLIVLAILGILVGIVAMSVGSLVDTARTTGMDAELQVVRTAIDTYNTQDVAVHGDDAIPPRLITPSAIDPVADEEVDAPFAKYLKPSKPTKYLYAWAAEGVTVANWEP